MNITRFKPEDLASIELQPEQAHAARTCTPEELEVLLSGVAYTAREGERVLGCGGVFAAERNVGIAWAHIDRRAGPHMAALVRAARRVLDVSGFDRIVATTRDGWCAGCRLLEILGFERLTDERGAFETIELPTDANHPHAVYVRAA